MDKIYIKLHESAYQGSVLAVSDADLIGRVLEDKEKDISFEVSESFYKGELVEMERLPELLDGKSSVNMIGNGVVDFAVKNGIIGKDSVIMIGGVKHAQLYKV